MLKRTSAFKRDDYSYVSPDGDEWEITILQTEDRKYVEIRQCGEDDDAKAESAAWDVEMLLDIANVVKQVCQSKAESDITPRQHAHSLAQPNVVDYRASTRETPSEMIEAVVEQSMENMDAASQPVESFSRVQATMTSDIEKRRREVDIPEEKRIQRKP